jgi:hypothetical protein
MFSSSSREGEKIFDIFLQQSHGSSSEHFYCHSVVQEKLQGKFPSYNQKHGNLCLFPWILIYKTIKRKFISYLKHVRKVVQDSKEWCATWRGRLRAEQKTGSF